jgi:quercetin dioxygenase-like cupin family protein
MSDQQRVPAVVVRSGEGELIPAAGVVHLFKLTGEQTEGRFGLEEFTVPPGTLGARPHIHQAHDEYFYVMSGQLMVATGDGETVLGPGDLAAAPRGSVHGFRNASETTPVQGLCMYTPPGYEQYFRDVHAAVAAGTELTVDLLAELRGRYRTDSL